jgi:hypothetical protein
MSETGPVDATIAGSAQRRCNIIRENALLTLVLCGVVRATQALAGDQPPSADSTPKHDSQDPRAAQAAGAPMFSAPNVSANPLAWAPFVSAKPLSDDPFSATEFRPRKHSVANLDSTRNGASIFDAPMLQSTSVWQQMADYKSQGRVRLLTLWQTRGSSLSLQAGKHGTPSLQWSTPWVHRGGPTRGLFDRLLAVPARAAGGNLRNSVSRSTGNSAPSKPVELSSTISAK